MKVGIVVFPGSNCDRDIFHVLTDVFDLEAEYFWHEKHLPSKIDAIILPGGFSYGDRLRAGVIAAHSPIISDVKSMAKKGVPVLGICKRESTVGQWSKDVAGGRPPSTDRLRL